MTAIIPVNEKFRIELDVFAWQVSRWKTRKGHAAGGNWEGISWHRTLQQAGESLAKRLVARQDLEGLNEVISALSAASRLIPAAIIESGLPDSWRAAKNYKGC